MVVTITSSDCPFVIWVEVQWMQCSQCSRTFAYFVNASFNSTNTISQDFDIVITDIKMPIMNGLEATRIIREEGASLPIIMQTAYAFSSDRENAMQAGASEVLVKPITVSALRGCLSSYFPEIKW